MGGLPLTAPRAVLGARRDPPDQAPWAMQLVTRMEKSSPPSRAALCAAAATAVVRLLTDERAAPEGEWGAAVMRWTSGRIRKHARRARGAAWQRVTELDGVTVEVDGAQVRALVPGALDALPPAVSKLQLSGSEPLVTGPAGIEPWPGGPPVVGLTGDPPIPLGKAVAAAGHAAQLALFTMPADRLEAWERIGYRILVEHPGPVRWRRLVAQAPVRVLDGGLTVVAPGTCTAVVRWA